MNKVLALAATTALCSMATAPDAALGAPLDPAATLGGGGTAPVTLGAPDPAPAPAADPAPAPAADPNVFTFRIPNTETDIGVNIANIPAELRMDFLQKGLRDYITNSVNQANVRATKANAAFDAYDEAMKANPLQEAVKKPEGERTVPDLLKVAADARGRLYSGDVRKQGDGSGTRKEARDPLVKMVTDAVVRELFEKNKAAGTKGYKYTDAVKEVGSDGIAYLDGKIAEKVAAGADAKALDAFKQDRYIKPAEMMLGRKDNKNTKDVSLLG